MERTINLHDGLEALYYFDTAYWDGGANELSDHSGHERHAAANGGPSVGNPGLRSFEVATFDGADDYFDAGPIVGNHDFSVAVIVKTEFDGSPNDCFGDAEIGTKGWGFQQESSGRSWKFRWHESDGNTYTVDIKGVQLGQWEMFVATWNGETISVLDGREGDFHTSDPNGFTPSDLSTHIGRFGGSARYFEGSIALAGVWNRALSSAEAKFITNLTSARRAML